ncbi:YkgJ family cysteine cluster protein [Pantoea sp. V106_11]|uniref:YkgJ family cysteine cluster protein n=1 Tax=Pantoea sp. V106_11 TaxID=3044234 RepID=UPI00249EFF24|nr:YkgJ family cysteine cluster protein [Pantoea sp. V106_11]MDI3414788.1 YkgJ family cysteine cluster protein [Pantoea sp. V106_11]
MKVCTDSCVVKSRLKKYNPKLKGKIIPPNPNFDNTKLFNHLMQGMKHPDDKIKAHNLLMASDEIADEMSINQLSVCQSGCAYCCKIPVDVSQIEAELISSYTNKKMNHYNNIKKIINKSTYCPFLDTTKAMCSIYAVRPLACRCFQTMDHYKYCKTPNVIHLTVTVNSSSKWVQIKNLLLDLSQNRVADIREWF